MGITILGNVGKIIEDNHGEMYFDNAKKIGLAEQKQTREVEDIVPVCPAEVETTHSEPALTNPAPLIFKPNEQNRLAVESLLKEALASSTKKSVVCRKLYEQRELFNLHAQDDTQKAAIINAWLKQLGIEKNFKSLFCRKDFGNYYCKA